MTALPPAGPAAAPAGPEASPATEAAVRLLTGLIAHGVRDVVLSPGSRSQALALAAVALARSGSVRVHVRIDERVAGFTALGIGRESGAPAVVVCTSGTAAAGYLPAAMEAFHAGMPLILLTADRPPELRGVGANQATIQPGMYRPWARLSVDAPVPGGTDPAVFADLAAEAVSAAVGVTGEGLAGVAGPVHLNLPAREPLSGRLPDPLRAAPGPVPRPTSAEPLPVARGPRTLVVAGADAGPDAERIARTGGWPLVAEIVSGSRFGDHVVPAYRERLRDPALAGRIERVMVFGHPTLSREVAALLRRTDIEIIAVRCGGERLNLSGAAVDARVIEVEADRAARTDDEAAWLAAWTRAEAPHADVDPDGALDRAALVRAVWAATGSDDRLLFGSSRIVRVADQVLAGKDVRVHANRGLAGIDGTIATGIGIALAARAGGETADGVPEGAGVGVARVLLGDLSLLHDVGSFLLPADEPSPRIQVVVGNDGGGTIFDGLEVAGTAAAGDLDRAFYTPQSVALGPLAAAYGWTFVRADTPAGLERALAASAAGPHLIEVPLAR
ncbi:2-succinyl-5-enolpyruvyl-6-hydroxy-3-cyclohexene-1-carboxylic-acid synthase [Microbacterium sp. Au-Mic1]|uniref:2-succinyl-5-enolpyruvyl-6-hydroxy-3- cyclohexene-1-carboxylic-acid synthase n=1 Tax=Microbacterium sp. Au-Mic1 TaxID=2906457 RepID=UPI001E399E01|nr:2-succinyl-5-enolpyruvyl-6-hydroxy-3-cyclohexene-1-carboxylic-acid synthase [Microbacterium sp. Au-Mic1]MCE4027410.1 2-succinyl-5-enolpyruvyl-6-hydroxy-3-cyclohexene-1-carboxylic-acid synthase [Microbacterium sp. Au-Mic1]